MINLLPYGSLVGLAGKSSPVITIFAIGLVCGMLTMFLRIFGGKAGTYAILIEYGGLLSAIGLVITLLTKVVGKLLSM